MKRRRLVVVLALAAACGGVAAWLWARQPSPVAVVAERPFTDLETALAEEGANGWELHISPRVPGPYRLLPGGTVLGGDPNMRSISRVRDKSGAVLEEQELQGNPAFDQIVVYLETLDGRQTMAVLKRPR